MNDSTLIELKILVERAVRPVQSCTTRKLKMREELMTHVIAAFDEEVAKLGSEQAALEQTARRFGNPVELTSRLQASIPKPDWRLWIERWLGFPQGESILRRAARHLGLLILVILPCFLIFIVEGRMREWPILIGMPMIAFLFTFLGHWLRQSLFLSPNRSWRVAIPVLVASAVVMPVATFAMCLIISASLSTSWMMIVPLLPTSILLTPVAFAVCTCMSAIELRQNREWETLPIDPIEQINI